MSNGGPILTKNRRLSSGGFARRRAMPQAIVGELRRSYGEREQPRGCDALSMSTQVRVFHFYLF